MIRFLAIMTISAGGAAAETARIYSGEHADFTRLVIELPAQGDWILGRTPMGYAFASGDGEQPSFDMSSVWDRIPKTRLQALRIDPLTGALQMTLACACHIFPFEYQPGVVVLDIKPGAAPASSAFEARFVLGVPEAARLPDEQTTAPVYDWLQSGRPAEKPATATEGIALPTGGVSLDPLRMELLEQISRGAAQGVVDMTLPGKPPEHLPEDRGTLPWSQIHIGPPPDVLLAAASEGHESMTQDGQVCIPDDRLALPDWGATRTPLDLLAEARSGLYGEFDALDPDAVLRAVHSHLYLGFGVEAAQYARLLQGTEAADEAIVLRSLTLLVEGERDPASPFLPMLGCDGAAAMWAALAHEAFPAGAVVNSDAIARSFAALPSHLRAALGADLAEKLLVHGNVEASRIIRNALERTPNVPSAEVALLNAKAELHEGEPEAAVDHATAALTEDGSKAEEWIAFVEAHFRKVEPVAPETVEALRAFEGEVEGTEQHAELIRAVALAELLSGQTASGFQTADEGGLPLSDFWRVATALAEDDAFLLEALAGQPSGIGPEVASEVGERLIDLGFPDAGLVWLGPTSPEDSPDRRRLAARAELARGDARRSLDLLSQLTEPEDQKLRASAFLQLGQIGSARQALAEAGLQEEALRIAAWEGAWPELQAAEAPLWAGAASEIGRDSAEELGPLARGAAILEASSASRASIEALLAGVAGPDP
ncbi:MAG: hypothetical protein JNN02_00070 [Tabrizicola sp.]|nr:hypothetical protein [Tabrizicola sp.]